MSQVYIGIDPGVAGAIAYINEDGSKYDVRDVPVVKVETKTKTKKGNKKKKTEYDLQSMARLLAPFNKYDRVHVIIEESIAMPSQSSSTTGKAFFGNGLWTGMIAAFGYGMTRTRPVTWKRIMMRDLPGNDKKASLLRARELFPDAELHLAKHDGRAEALLLAEFLRRDMQRGV